MIILAVASLSDSVVGPTFAGDDNGRRRQHPRRNEVMRRDGNIARQIRDDRGNLDGNYRSLRNEDQAIRQQARSEFKANGGYLTKKQQRQLNKEENELKTDVRQDR